MMELETGAFGLGYQGVSPVHFLHGHGDGDGESPKSWKRAMGSFTHIRIVNLQPSSIYIGTPDGGRMHHLIGPSNFFCLNI